MKNKIFLGVAVSACALGWAAKDPIVMTINGVDVPKSEFEYLYHKNAQQQMAQQPIDEYVKMFVNYKLKVADAKAMGIDTMSSFIKEMNQYRSDLAAPYIADSVFLNKLVDEAYQHAAEDIKVSHIMLGKSYDDKQDAATIAKLDSLRDEILKGASFAELAPKYSLFKRSAMNGGSLGYISINSLPYNFEKAAYELKDGELSEVVESAGTYHIIKREASRPAVTQVQVSHILKLVPKDATPEQHIAIKATIDSLYNVVSANPASFAEVARKYSEDPGSAAAGGKMDWFGKGRMVPQFEEESFALEDGAISKPIRTAYGYHIILKHGHKGAPTKEQLKPSLLARMQSPNDERYRPIREDQIAKLAAKHKASLNDKTIGEMKADIKVAGLDSAFYDKYSNPTLEARQIAKVGKKSITVGDFIPFMRNLMQNNPNIADYIFDDRLEAFYLSKLASAEQDWLEANEPDYRNLLHEYRDGSLLYEASVRNVWDKASKDQEGLQKYWESHRDDYTWSEPRVKGYLVQVKNDSVAQLVKARYPQLAPDTMINTLRKEFKGNVKIDKVLAPKGANSMVDAVMFGGAPVQPKMPGYSEYFMIDAKILDAPEEMNDVKAQVTSDYQAVLEKDWIDRLHKTYPVSINEKNLKTVK